MLFSTFLVAALSAGSTSATPPTAAILADGLSLYQLERASWVATDLMLATTIDRAQIGGYLSYLDGDSVRTIFWAHEAGGNVGSPLLASYAFPRRDVRVETANFRPAGTFNAHEAKLFTIRIAAKAELNAPEKGYVTPPNSSLNLAFLEDKNETRVYVLTGPEESGIVPIGNDYLFVFSPSGQLKHSERLHNSYLPMRRDASLGTIETMIHSHLEAHPYITPTDICSILLYKEQLSARQHHVIGKEYVSLFDIDKQQLIILTRKAFEKIINDKH
ncbi:MAG: hypothetical protein EOO62_02060 [Hymenobacter sp.]|nr:MAG: hypothetical protein EOO62_02060 [Hymenobacter sp.]